MLTTSLRIWTSLMVRDIRTRRGQSRYGFLQNIIEPVGQLTIIYLVFAWIQREPKYGHSLFLFLVSGAIPYFLFVHCVGRIMASLRLAQPLRFLRVVTPVDIAVASLLLEVLTIVIASSILFLLCWSFDVPGAVPRAPAIVILATGAAALSAFGVGLTNGCLVYFFPPYRLIWSLFTRSLVFFSSLFFIVDDMPDRIRYVLSWNPVLQCVVWFRLGVYGTFPHHALSLSYLFGTVIFTALLGLSLERIVRRQA